MGKIESINLSLSHPPKKVNTILTPVLEGFKGQLLFNQETDCREVLWGLL